MTLSKVKCPPTIGDHLEEMIIPIPTIFQRCKPEVSFQIDGFIAITDGTQVYIAKRWKQEISLMNF